MRAALNAVVTDADGAPISMLRAIIRGIIARAVDDLQCLKMVLERARAIEPKSKGSVIVVTEDNLSGTPGGRRGRGKLARTIERGSSDATSVPEDELNRIFAEELVREVLIRRNGKLTKITVLELLIDAVIRRARAGSNGHARLLLQHGYLDPAKDIVLVVEPDAHLL